MQLQSRISAFVDIAAAASSAAAELIGLAERVRELVRRVRRAGLLFAIIVAALIVYSLAISPIGLLLWLIATPLAAFASMLSLLWPSRPRVHASSLHAPDLSPLARSAHSSLMQNRARMPAEVRQLAGAIATQLKAIELGSIGCSLDALADADARRLLSNHLPRLLTSYSRLSPAQRQESGTRANLHEGLKAISRELESICAKLERQYSDDLDTERRFLVTKYADPALGHSVA